VAVGGDRPALQGREEAVAALNGAVAEAVAGGQGRIVVLEGEAGIGKSRLIAEVSVAARDAGMVVAAGAADSLALGRPFGALIDALELATGSPDAERARLADLLFGALDGTGQDRPDVQYLLQEGLIALLEHEAAAAPRLLALDDLQWSDRATLAAIVAIAKRTVDLPLVLVLTARLTPRSPELDQTLGRLTDVGAVTVPLGPLPAEVVETLAATVMGSQPGPGLLDQLQGCSGNPFFVIETIRMLEAEGAIDEDQGVADIRNRTLPAPLRSSLVRRVDSLSPAAQEALRTAAILGSSFAVDDLAVLLHRSVPATATATHEAVRAGFLEDAGPHLAFRHELIREALYEDLPRAVRGALHRDAAATLTERVPTHVIAQHLALGAEPGDVEAVAWLRRAAEEAGPRDPATAVDLLRRALDLQGEEHDPALARDFIDALAWAGHLDEAEREAKAALDDVDDPTQEGALRLALARCRVLQGNSVGAIRQLEMASATPGLDDRSRAWIAAYAATARFSTYDLDRTVEEAQAALAWGEQLDDRGLQAAGASIACRVATMRADFDQAFALGERAVSVAADDAEALRRLPHLYLGVALYDGDRSSEAIHTMREGIRRSEAIGAAWALPRQHHTLVAACFYAGAWDDALAEAETGATLAGEVGSWAWFPQAQSIAGTILFHRGDLEAAGAAAAVAKADMRRPGSDAGGLGWLGPLESLLCEAEGDLDRAFAKAQRVHELAIDLGVVTREQRLAPQVVRLALTLGDRAAAERAAERATRHAAGRPASFQAAAAVCEGLLAGDAGRLREAADLYRDVSPIDFILTARAAADALGAAGGRDDARPLLEEALTWCAKLGADRHGRAISELLDEWSGHRGRRTTYQDRPVTGWESLTPAELRVAELVGAGLSNADIAEQLFVSRRTVESHVGHVYQKLQIKGRVALAIEAAAHG
jgi:DNA-binding CsgD family transcriptional regulator/tetratricopeptide (TPR) repeat protein